MHVTTQVLCCRWVSTTPWAFPCCSHLVLPEVNRKLPQSWSFYSLYSALCEIKINIESNFCIRTSPRAEFLLTPQTRSSSHCPEGEELTARVPWGYWCVGSTPEWAGKPFSCPLHIPVPHLPGVLRFPELSLSRQPPQYRDLFTNTALSPTSGHRPRAITLLSPNMKADVLEATYLGKSCVNLTVYTAILQADLRQISSLSQAPPWCTEQWLSCPAPLIPVETMHTGGKIKANASKIGELETNDNSNAQVEK